MNDLLNLLIGLAMGLNLVALGTSRLPALIRVAALQGMVLGIMPLVIEHEWRVMVLAIAVATVIMKGIVIPALLHFLDHAAHFPAGPVRRIVKHDEAAGRRPALQPLRRGHRR